MNNKNAISKELIAPCGMNCGICIAFFGYTMSGKKRKHTCITCRLRERSCAFIKKQCNKLKDGELEYLVLRLPRVFFSLLTMPVSSPEFGGQMGKVFLKEMFQRL